MRGALVVALALPLLPSPAAGEGASAQIEAFVRLLEDPHLEGCVTVHLECWGYNRTCPECPTVWPGDLDGDCRVGWADQQILDALRLTDYTAEGCAAQEPQP